MPTRTAMRSSSLALPGRRDLRASFCWTLSLGGEALEALEPSVHGGLRGWPGEPLGELAEREGGIASAELGGLAQVRREIVEVAPRREPADGRELVPRRAARADEVRVVGVREPVRPSASGSDDPGLLQREGRVVRADEAEQLGDRIAAPRVGGGVS